MSNETYTTYSTNKQDLILRDVLAIDRTAMTNESSLMAFTRTTLAIIGTAAAIYKFVPELQYLSYGLLLAAVITISFGIYKYLQKNKTLNTLVPEISSECP